MRATMRVAGEFLPLVKARRAALAYLVLTLFSCAVFSAGERVVRFLRLEEAAETLKLFADAGLSTSDIKDSPGWNEWVRTRDDEVRARIDGGLEDSISNLILYGAFYTNLARLESAESAASETGDLTLVARARVHALAAALPNATRNERLRFVREFLARKGVAREFGEAKLQDNLRRMAAGHLAYQGKLKYAVTA